jgi:hypothetical protein
MKYTSSTNRLKAKLSATFEKTVLHFCVKIYPIYYLIHLSLNFHPKEWPKKPAKVEIKTSKFKSFLYDVCCILMWITVNVAGSRLNDSQGFKLLKTYPPTVLDHFGQIGCHLNLGPLSLVKQLLTKPGLFRTATVLSFLLLLVAAV